MVSGPHAPVLASLVIRQALVPMAAFYLILMAALGLGLLGLRRRGESQAAAGPERGQAATGGPPRGWAALTRHVLSTVIGGYLLLMAVVAAYYYGVARVGGAFLSSAVTGTALLIGLTVPVFAAASWISRRVPGWRGKPPGESR
jgi:hypothetical protein